METRLGGTRTRDSSRFARARAYPALWVPLGMARRPERGGRTSRRTIPMGLKGESEVREGRVTFLVAPATASHVTIVPAWVQWREAREEPLVGATKPSGAFSTKFEASG